MDNNEVTSKLKLKIAELKQCINENENELEKTINELHSVCEHDVAKVEHIYDYDRNRYEITCINCNKVLRYCNGIGFARFKEEYKGELI